MSTGIITALLLTASVRQAGLWTPIAHTRPVGAGLHRVNKRSKKNEGVNDASSSRA